MPIYRINNKKLVSVKEKSIDLKKGLQSIIEPNLHTVFGYQLVSSEFRLDNFRIDTLAWNPDTKSFVIIEYKKDRNFSVFDQGFSYLILLFNKKANFILEYNERMNSPLKIDGVDWEQSRIIFIAPQFTQHQINAVNFRNVPFDLYEVKLYDNGTLSVNQIIPAVQVGALESVIKDQKLRSLAREIKTYTVNDHFKRGWEQIRELYDKLEERILALDPNFVVNPTKYYIRVPIGRK